MRTGPSKPRSASRAWATAWPVPFCRRWIATSTAPWPNRSSTAARTASAWWPRTHTIREAPSARASATGYSISGRPATRWSTFAVDDFIRVPRPAARITVASFIVRSLSMPPRGKQSPAAPSLDAPAPFFVQVHHFAAASADRFDAVASLLEWVRLGADRTIARGGRGGARSRRGGGAAGAFRRRRRGGGRARRLRAGRRGGAAAGDAARPVAGARAAAGARAGAAHPVGAGSVSCARKAGNGGARRAGGRRRRRAGSAARAAPLRRRRVLAPRRARAGMGRRRRGGARAVGARFRRARRRARARARRGGGALRAAARRRRAPLPRRRVRDGQAGRRRAQLLVGHRPPL